MESEDIPLVAIGACVVTTTAPTEMATGDYYDEDRPRRRAKVCLEYENGDEYRRYR
jgi:hypothetical protein